MNEASLEQTEPAGKGKSIARTLLWGVFGAFCIAFFTVIRLSNTRLKTVLEAHLMNFARQSGYQLTIGDSSFSLFMGLRYRVENAQLKPVGADESLVFDRIDVSPSFSSLLAGKPGLSLLMKRKKGEISGTAAMRGTDFTVNLGIDELDLADVNLLPALAKLKGRGKLSGDIKLSGASTNPSSWNGDVKLAAKGLQLDSQNILGLDFKEPIVISQVDLEGPVQQGKVQIKTGRFGKAGDDIGGTVSGDLSLNQLLMSSRLNVSMKFTLSRKVLDPLGYLESMISSAKQADGAYAFQCTGTLGFPSCMPGNGAPPVR